MAFFENSSLIASSKVLDSLYKFPILIEFTLPFLIFLEAELEDAELDGDNDEER